MSVCFSRDVARGVADRLRGHWGGDIESVEVSDIRVRGRLRRLFHVQITAVDPLVGTLSGWDRDLTDLIGDSAFEGGLKDLLVRIDEVTASVIREHAIPPAPRRRQTLPSAGWSARKADALRARRRIEAGETVTVRMTPEETAAVFDEVWPGVEVHRRDDEFGRVDLEARPYGGNRVGIGISRRGTLVVPIADGEGVPYPSGRSSITDGLHGQVLSALETADVWLRTTAPIDEVLMRPVIR